MFIDDTENLPVPVDAITSIIGYSADLYSFGLKMSLKSMPELSMGIAKKMARKAGHVQFARSYIRARHINIVKTQSLSKGAKNFVNIYEEMYGDSYFDDNVEKFKDWFAELWNVFWDFSWAN